MCQGEIQSNFFLLRCVLKITHEIKSEVLWYKLTMWCAGLKVILMTSPNTQFRPNHYLCFSAMCNRMSTCATFRLFMKWTAKSDCMPVNILWHHQVKYTSIWYGRKNLWGTLVNNHKNWYYWLQRTLQYFQLKMEQCETSLVWDRIVSWRVMVTVWVMSSCQKRP